MREIVHSIPIPVIFLITTCYFLLIYFSFAAFFMFLRNKIFPILHFGENIQTQAIPQNQIQREIKASVVSILVFGVYGMLTAWLERVGILNINWSPTLPGALLELFILFLWNEIHFYASHRLLHHPKLFSKIHFRHHQSKIPTPYSSFSFHWGEALLLGSVMLLAAPFVSLSWVGVIGLPLISITGNNLGHLNYDFFPQAKTSSNRRHSDHHKYIHGNFGFLLGLPDKILKTEIKR
jgi:sterol desaturase/sphingolipid hydroxylase (fatty acid hydroxylase superfamily)